MPAPFTVMLSVNQLQAGCKSISAPSDSPAIEVALACGVAVPPCALSSKAITAEPTSAIKITTPIDMYALLKLISEPAFRYLSFGYLCRLHFRLIQ